MDIAIKHIRDVLDEVDQGGQTCIKAYKDLRYLEEFISKAIEQLKDKVIDEVENNPGEYTEFIVSRYTKYNYKESPLYKDKLEELNSKKEEIKNIESLIKDATDKATQNITICDKDGIMIEPVQFTVTTRLSYTPRKD